MNEAGGQMQEHWASSHIGMTAACLYSALLALLDSRHSGNGEFSPAYAQHTAPCSDRTDCKR